ncbi:hypothetical protein AHiyo8_10930 [Arthrobacter sp. Hiyo8]|nr:hypothetical protein AHiyo8_10930 [Arthrobacter sp. Hiyo8]
MPPDLGTVEMCFQMHQMRKAVAPVQGVGHNIGNQDRIEACPLK